MLGLDDVVVVDEGEMVAARLGGARIGGPAASHVRGQVREP